MQVMISVRGGVPNGSVLIAVVDEGVIDLKPLPTPTTVEDILGSVESRGQWLVR